ncbi:MAG: hypothetical protein JRJ59_08755 [Deltaproteobacteria bacterium]|nr:hypothetical protein [Deltaproteobacteria bacterium]
MSKAKDEKADKDWTEIECPFCYFLRACQSRKKKHPQFFDHLQQAEAEVLKAVRSLIDERLEACQAEKNSRKATKIKVE